MSARAPRIGAVFVGALLALIACAPEPTAEDRGVYDAEFDGDCAGVPCGWTQIAGAPGAAHTVGTLLPGLRGLALVGDGVLVDGPGGDRVPLGLTGMPLDVVLQARCDASASLTVRVALTSVDPPDGSVDGAATLLEARLHPLATWSTGADSSGELRQPLVTLLGPSEGGGSVRIESVTIRKEGAGQCEIDLLRIEQAYLYGDFVTDGCI